MRNYFNRVVSIINTILQCLKMFDKDLFEVLRNDPENSWPSFFCLLRLGEQVN